MHKSICQKPSFKVCTVDQINPKSTVLLQENVWWVFPLCVAMFTLKLRKFAHYSKLLLSKYCKISAAWLNQVKTSTWQAARTHPSHSRLLCFFSEHVKKIGLSDLFLFLFPLYCNIFHFSDNEKETIKSPYWGKIVTKTMF